MEWKSPGQIILFEGARGFIKEILISEPVDTIAMIASTKGSICGDHYHKDSIQWVYLMTGSLTFLTQFEEEDIISRLIRLSGLVKTEILMRHTLIAGEALEFLPFTRGPSHDD